MPALESRFLNMLQPPDPPASSRQSSSSASSKLGETASVLKTLVIPALISLGLFLVLSYIVVPAWRRYRNRYSHYLPLDVISTRTRSLRERLEGGFAILLLPSTWLANLRRHPEFAIVADAGGEGIFDDDDGEELAAVNHRRREAISLDAHRPDDSRRLSRELEEGFRDDSEDEDQRSELVLATNRMGI